MIRFSISVILILYPCIVLAADTNDTHIIEVVYWEIKPFIFTDDEGKLTGILPEIFDRADYLCRGNSSQPLVKYIKKLQTRKQFYDLFHSQEDYGEGLLANVSHDKALWAPVFSRKEKNASKYIKTEKSLTFQLLTSKEVVVIVTRRYISLPNKIIRGISSCGVIYLIAFIFSALLSMLIWFIEHFNNADFQSSFFRGVGTGLWWSIVSMTTVGYGDIKVRSIMGRLVAVIWLFFGVMIACIITATMTDAVAGLGDLHVNGKTVAVLENSYDSKVAAEDYNANIMTGESYHAVLQMVRDGRVFAAMMNADVAAWHQNEIFSDNNDEPLRIVQILPASLNVNCHTPKFLSGKAKKAYRCMYNFRQQVYESPVERFKRGCHHETLYIGTVRDIMVDNKFIQAVIAIVFCLLTIGVAYEVIIWKKIMRNERKLEKYCQANPCL